MTDLATMTATDLLALYRSGQASPTEATHAVLARIERLNPVLNAFCHRRAGPGARADAAASTERWAKSAPCGPLDGVPVSIKDLIVTKGWPTLRGSRTVDPNQPWDVDAPATARLREAGRRAARQDHDAGIRLQRRDRLTVDRHHAQSLEYREDPWRLVRAALPPPLQRGLGRSASAPTAPAACASRRRSAAISA